MAFVNYNNKEITVKIVYYGPALSGKTTCLQYVYESGEYRKKGKLITLDTDGDRTLFFDFLPIEIGKLGDYSIKMQLYTVPGQVAYNTTRKLVLQGSDGIVFVADSQVVMREQNLDSFNNLKENLKANSISYDETPLLFLYNKRDLKEILPTDILNNDLNPENKLYFASVGTSGENVLEALHAIMKLVIIHLKNKLTIFQKDKTVMFSREELTDSIAKKEAANKAKQKQKPSKAAAKPKPEPAKSQPAIFTEDTEREDIFELSSPMSDEPMKTNDFERDNAFEKDDEIFNLGDENRFENEELPSLELPAVNPSEPASSPSSRKKKAPPTPRHMDIGVPEDEVEEIGQEYQVQVANSGNDDGSLQVPLNVVIPEDKDEITINLNLKIVIKKKP